jgi:hypothetical protein
VIRTIDALKTFDTIYVITNGGPGTASETINLYLYLQAFAFYNIGNASAVVVIFFIIVMALALPPSTCANDQMDVTATPATRCGGARASGSAGCAGRVRIFGRSDRVTGDPRVPCGCCRCRSGADRQHRLSADVHSQSADVRISSRYSNRTLSAAISEQHRGLRGRRSLPSDRHSAGYGIARTGAQPHRADPDRADDACALVSDTAYAVFSS